MSDNTYALGIGFTSACNMNCSFCYSRDKRQGAPELALDDWKRFIVRNAAFIDSINYGTGENALSDDWFKLVAFIGKNYPWIKQAVTTNGTLIRRCFNSELCLDITKRYISEVDVSIDFCDEQRHDIIRGKKGAFQGAVDTLEFCKQFAIQPTIVFLGVAETMEKNNLRGLFDIARRFDSYLRMNIYRPVRDRTGFAPPSLSVILETLDWISENEVIVSLSDPFFGATCTEYSVHQDPTGISSARITQDGKIYPSTYLLKGKYCIGSIFDDNSIDRLLDNNTIGLIGKNTPPKDCMGCSLYERCKGGAVDRRLLINDTIDSRDPYCPGRFKQGEQLRRYKEENNDFSSVHDKYLPTIFFKARRNDY